MSGGTLTTTSTDDQANGTIFYNGGTMSLGFVSVRGGRILLSSGGGKVLETSSVLIAASPASFVDVNDNAMILSGETAAGVAADIAYNGGAWNGPGITSSAAAAAVPFTHRTALGYARPADIGASSFFGRGVFGNETLIRYTYASDGNLDGKIDLTDFTFLAANFNGSGKTWLQGDFNYDGTVNLTDFTLLASNFNLALPAASAGLGAAVPESCIVWLPCAAMLRRPRRCASPR